MTLTTRVSAFFLAALAGALIIYSLVFYSVTSRQIHFQFDRELSGALHSLVAAAEVEETEVKWQPLEHSIAFGSLDEFGEAQWIVVGDQQLVVEASPTATPTFRSRAMELAALTVSSGTIRNSVLASEPTMLMYQRLRAPRPVSLNRELDEFDEVLVVVGRATVKRDAMLGRLTLLVILLPLAAWLIAALLGRWLVRQALRPVSAMSHQARSIAGSDFQARLKIDDSGDELAELSSTFNRLLDRQQAAFDQQRRFAGDAAHELRSPLTVLMGEIDVTLRKPRTQAEYQQTLSVLRTHCRSLQEIVESLLFLARNEADATLPQLQPIDIHTWLDEQQHSWKHFPRVNDLNLENHVAAGTEAFATPSLLTQIISNLVANALKYSEPGTPVTISSETHGGGVFIHVIDRGCGIEADDRPHIFNPFFRSREARNLGIAGNGLGLAIAHRIARKLGGELSCESTPGQGSRFSLRLPQHTDSSDFNSRGGR